MNFLKDNGEWKANDKPVDVVPLQVNRMDCTIPKLVAEEAYKEYAARYGSSQSLDRLSERGGFGASEIAILLFQRIKRQS